MPCAASMETVKLVPYCAPFFCVICGRRRRSTNSSFIGRQTSPRACLIIKLIACGVTNCAAITKSPSFSRSSASVMMTILPALMSARISGMVETAVMVCLPSCKFWDGAWTVSSHMAGIAAACSILRAFFSPKDLFFNRAESSPGLTAAVWAKSACLPPQRSSIHCRRLARRSSVMFMKVY